MKEYQDYFFKKAKKEGLRSRAHFKLEEIDRKYRLLQKSGVVLDLGCAPGSWLQFAAGKVGPKGLVVGVDKAALPGDFPPWVHILQADIFTLDMQALRTLAPQGFDLVLSDAAPSTTGERFVDQQNSLRLAERVVEIAMAVLKPGGNLLLKIFQSQDAKALLQKCWQIFQTMRIEKPASSRQESMEVYWVTLHFFSR